MLLTQPRGPSRILIYNEAYSLVLGEKHPIAMGMGFMDLFPEIGNIIMPCFEKAESTKTTVSLEEVTLTILRNNFIEETIFKGAFVPLMLFDGSIGGCNNAPIEVTRQRLSDRRSRMLNRISVCSDDLTSTTVYRHIAECFSTNNLDVPFAMLFKVDSEAADGNHRLMLVEDLGLPPADSPERQDWQLHDERGLMPYLRAAQETPITTYIDSSFTGLDLSKVVWGGHQSQSQCLTTIPLLSAGRLHGFLVLGNNPRRPIDDQHDDFISDVQRYATAAITAVVGAEERKAKNDQLQVRLIESERRIRYMAQHSDIGMVQLALDGTLIWANEHYCSTINQEDDNKPRRTFISADQLLAEDCDKAAHAWLQVLQGRKAEVTELRLQRKYTPPVGDSIPSTILLSAFPYSEKGRIVSIMACMTDVSRLKWAESLQAQMARDASEAKRQQSEFTDAVSHEVRNPLSAILLLADSISGSFNGLDNTLEGCQKRLAENVDAAKIILNCAQHQKQIVDDVLTLSKMDFTMVSLSPSPVAPDDIVQGALRLVEADATASSVSLETISESSLTDLTATQVMCDPLRVTQVLVNLLSNAVKFTKRKARRVITITYGATLSSPTEAFPQHITWAPRRRSYEDATLAANAGKGEPLYLTFRVEDTGPGMTEEQMTRIFERFEQATPRTTIKYGGSGLGLFISHSLIEKQSGRIGVSSTPGSGSTFAFYIKTRRVQESSDSPMNGYSSTKIQRQLVAQDIETNKNSQVSSPPAKRKANTLRSSDYHILLVEDNLINQQVLRKQLTKTGCTVHVANNGLEALKFLRSSSWWTENRGQGPQLDVILLDWEMPVMDGLTCIREIRSLEKSHQFATRPEVIAVTANVRAEQVRIAEEAGMDALMPKPFVIADLLGMIASRLNR